MICKFFFSDSFVFFGNFFDLGVYRIRRVGKVFRFVILFVFVGCKSCNIFL